MSDRSGVALQQRGLAGAVVAEQTDGLPDRDLEVHVVEGIELPHLVLAEVEEALLEALVRLGVAAEPLGHADDLDRGPHPSSSPRSASSFPKHLTPTNRPTHSAAPDRP